MHTVGRSMTTTVKKIILAFKEKKKNYVHEIKDDSAWNISWNTLPFSLTFSAFLMRGRRVSLCELMLTERFRLVIVGSD